MSAVRSEASATCEPSTAMRWFLAALSVGAGAIHLVMVPQHAQESLRVGLAFAAAGWFEIAFGVAMLARPTRPWVRLAAATNLVFIATWMLSRTVGLPTWTGDGGVEDASSVDILCVAFEVGIVIGSIALLAAPNLLERWTRSALTAASVVPAGILVATTAVLASPDAANHADDHAAADAHAGQEHAHDPSGTVSAGTHHHADSTIAYDELPDATRAEVDQVIAQWATRYPTAADATRDGWFIGTRSLYGIGAHYVRGNVLSGAATFDLLNPNILLFDGDGPDAKFAGVSYTVAEEPEGFTGDYDVWHSHTSVCRQGGSIVSLSEEDSPVWLSESDCTAQGGQVFPLSNAEMMHLWIGPEYIDGAPIFAHDHPDLYDGYNPKRDA
jgi:hypothetical protein